MVTMRLVVLAIINNHDRGRDRQACGPPSSAAGSVFVVAATGMMMVTAPVVMMLLVRVDVAVPRLSLARRCAQVEARPDQPEKNEESNDGSNDNAGNGSAAECSSPSAAVATF
jgi:hypothetical protein